MRYMVFSLLLLGLLACEEEISEEAKAALIAAEVQKRVVALTESKYDRCMNELYESANTIVDSILIARAKMEKNTIKKPSKPNKPEAPAPLKLRDSTAIKPLLPSRDSSGN